MYRYATLAVVLALSAAAQAQVTWDPTYVGYSYGYNTIDMDLQWDGNSVVPTTTQQSDGYTVTYDATVLPKYPYPDPNATITWTLQGTGNFHVGPIPVLATLTLNVNGKLVNGGGDANNPSTSLSWSSMLYYDLDDSHYVSAGDVSVPAFSLSSGANLVGNGLTVIDDTQTMSASFVLAPEYSYVLQYNQGWSISDLPTGPMASTFEGGGETAFSGITLTLDAVPVPEPASALLLLVGLAGMTRQCKKK